MSMPPSEGKVSQYRKDGTFELLVNSPLAKFVSPKIVVRK